MYLGIYIFCFILLLFFWLFSRSKEYKQRVRNLIIADPVVITKSSNSPNTLLGRGTHFLSTYFGMLFPSGAEISKMSEMLIRANLYNINAEELFTIRIILSAAVGVLGFLLFLAASVKFFILLSMSLSFGYMGYLLPRVFVSNRASSRQQKAKKEILNYIELLSTATEAGLTIVDGIKRVTEYSPGVLAEEFNLAWVEVHGGKNRADAFKSLSKRLDVDDITIFIDDILHAEKQGTPIAQVMKRQAHRIREKAKTQGVESAQKASSATLFPTIGLIFIPMLALAMAPLFITLSRSFRF